jgi:D-alanyl-D-alanine carboxypeptidase
LLTKRCFISSAARDERTIIVVVSLDRTKRTNRGTATTYKHNKTNASTIDYKKRKHSKARYGADNQTERTNDRQQVFVVVNDCYSRSARTTFKRKSEAGFASLSSLQYCTFRQYKYQRNQANERAERRAR